MVGLLVMSADGDLSVAILPNPLDRSVVMLHVQFHDLELPPIPVPVAELRASLEVWFGKPKTN